MGWTKGRVLGLCIVSVLGSCGGPRPAADSVSPSERVMAAAHARADDAGTLNDLVAMLDSADPAVRLVAIRTLERRTGETLGYRHYDPPWQRAEAVDRWQAWLAEAGGTRSRPAPAAVDSVSGPARNPEVQRVPGIPGIPGVPGVPGASWEQGGGHAAIGRGG